MLPYLPATTIRLVQYGPQTIDSGTGLPSWPIVRDVEVRQVIQEPWNNSRSAQIPEGVRAEHARLFHIPGERVTSGSRDGTARADEIVWDGRVWRVVEALDGVAMPGIPARTSAYCMQVGSDDQPAPGVTP